MSNIEFWESAVEDLEGNARGWMGEWLERLRAPGPFDCGDLAPFPGTFGAGFTLLMAAASLGNEGACAWLLARGADPNARDFYDQTALLHGIDSEDVVRVLLAGGADPDYTEEEGEAPVCRAKRPEVLNLLLAAGAAPDLQRCGYTALQTAASSTIVGDPERARLLLAAGADARRIGAGGWPAAPEMAAERARYLSAYEAAGGYRAWLEAAHPGAAARWGL